MLLAMCIIMYIDFAMMCMQTGEIHTISGFTYIEVQYERKLSRTTFFRDY